MICIKCNSNLPKHSNFCPNCGAAVSINSDSSDNIRKSATNINPFLIIIISGIVAILGIVLILDSNVSEKKISNSISNKQNQETTEIFSKIESINSDLQNDPNNIRLNIEMGNNLFDVKQYRKAIPHYKIALESNPENVEVRIDLAVSYYNLQVNDSAFVEIEKALRLSPNHQQGLYNLGVMHYNSGNKEKAKDSWTKLIELHNGSQAAETAKQLLKNI